MMGIDGRWSAIRITLESQLIGLALILLATARAWEQFDTSNALTYVFAGGIALLLVGLAALWSAMVLHPSTAGTRREHLMRARAGLIARPQPIGEPVRSHGARTPPTSFVSSCRSLSVSSMATGWRAPTPSW